MTITNLPWPFGSKRPQIYLCKCEKCGFQQMYEVSDTETIQCGKAPDDDDQIINVTQTPTTCPQCGNRLSRKKMDKLIRY